MMQDIFEHKRLLQLHRPVSFFHALVSAIIYQQISPRAGETITRRLMEICTPCTPERLQKITDDEFRAIGISPQKQKYVRDLAEKSIQGIITETLDTYADDEIRKRLLSVKGIGPWTVDMFFIFSLQRPNILPLQDLGIQKGFQKYFHLAHLPDAGEMLTLAKPYQGSWTELSLFLWEYKDNDALEKSRNRKKSKQDNSKV